MIGKPKIVAVVGAIALALSDPLAADEPPYPVWWSESLELDSLDAIDARLERHIWPGNNEGLPLHKSEGGTRKEAPAITCNDLTRLTEAGYDAIGNNNYKIQQYTLAYCGAIALLNQAAPAERSYLRNFVLDEDSVKYLPAMAFRMPSCDYQCRQRVANERRIPLSRFEPILRVINTGIDEIDVMTVSMETRVTILARGDFNADGVDDMLVLSNTHATEGTGGWTDFYLLTREARGEVLRVLNLEGHGCAQYQCDATYDDPEALRETGGLDALHEARERKRRGPITANAVGRFPGRSGVVPASQGPPYPVWWGPYMGLESREDIDERLADEFWFGSNGTLLEMQTAGRMGRVTVKTCRALLSRVEAGYRFNALYRSHESLITDCRALRALKGARPARLSHLRNFRLDEEVMEVLPALLGFWTSPCVACRARAFNEGRQSWARYNAERAAKGQVPSFLDGSVYRLSIFSERQFRARALAWSIDIEIVAGGDFNGDGLDDILVQRDIRADRSAYNDSALFILSRDSPGGVLWVVNADEAVGSGWPCADAASQCSMRARNDETYPVWWSEDFELPNLEAIGGRVQRSFSLPGGDAFRMDTWAGLEGGPVLAGNCPRLLDYLDKGYSIRTDYQIGQWQAMRCRTIMAMRDARPAQASHLRDFALDETSIGLLPLLFGDSGLRFGRCRQQLYNKARFAIAADLADRPPRGQNVFDSADPTFEFQSESDREIIVSTRHQRAQLTIVAGGDFNGDGLDDILLEVSRWQAGPAFGKKPGDGGDRLSVGQRYGTDHKLFILSRDCSDAVLWAVNADNFLQSKADCEVWQAGEEWSAENP